MERLSPLDAGFLEVEDSNPHVSLAVGGVSILEGPAPDDGDLVAMLAERVSSIPRCRQVLRTYPLDLQPPEWVDDPAFDIAHHVRRVALPQPGGDAELFEAVATVMEHRLEREHPLWECWIIEGLSGDRWAMLTKLHHCIADGIAITRLLGKFSDDGGGETFATDVGAGRKPPRADGGTPGISLNPVHWIGAIGRSALAAAAATEHAAVGAAELVTTLMRPAPETSLKGPMLTRRRFSAVRVRLADMQEVSRAFGVTMNDVALAAITSAYRTILLERGEHPERASLRMLVPVSMRAVEQFSAADNQVSAMLPLLPVDVADPVEQLRVVHKRLARSKSSGQSEGGNAVLGLARAIPFAFSAWAIRVLARLPQRAVVGLATNVPGPRAQQRLMGRRVLEILPIPPIALALRTGIAMLSYADTFVFGITADYDSAPDIDALAAEIERGVARLVSAARQRRRAGATAASVPG